jgi:hypothetical protein
MRYDLRSVVRIAIVAPIVALLASQVFALDDIGLPIHPKAIASSIVRRSGKGERTNWLIVGFEVKAQYDEVVEYYKQKTGSKVQMSKTVSEKFLNTLILFAKTPQDQINVNISSQVGKEVTEVEITRNLFRE